MADETAQAATSASSDPQTQTQQSSPTTPAPGESGTATTIPNPEAKKYADEAAAERKARKALEAKLAQIDEERKQAELAKLGETERLQKQYEALQQQHAAAQLELQSTRLLQEIARHAPSLNLVDPDAAQALLERGGELDYDDRGNPTNVAKLLEQLVAAKPWLVASNVTRPPAPPSSGGATNPGRSALAATPTAQPKIDPKEAYKNRRGLANPVLWKRS
ncbi:MAG: phage scaffolding protein [Ktedonobacterales bacterium]